MAGAGTALAVLWVLFGEVELGLASIILLVAVGASFVWIHRGQPQVTVERRTTPSALHEGDHASVSLRLVNQGYPLRQLTVTDEVAGLGTADFAGAALPRRTAYTATYRVLCRPRGIYRIGPAALKISDPLGLASRSASLGSPDTLVVYPAVEDLSGFPDVLGRNLAIQAHRPDHSHRGGEDFYTLREYQQGDDLRRIHWPSSARQDRLMIRQLETPWQARSLVLLDVRDRSYPDLAMFESAVSGAASVVRHLVGHSFETHAWVGGPARTISPGNGGYPVVMEQLARAQPQPGVDLGAVAARLRRQGGGGILVMATGRPDAYLLGLARLLSPEYPTAVLLLSGGDSTDSVGDFQRAGVTTVAADPDQGWAPAWNRAMRTTWHAASVGS